MYTAFVMYFTIIVMIRFIGSYKLQIQADRLSNVNQRSKKVTIMMIGWCQQRNKRKALARFCINGCKRMHSVTDDIDRLIPLIATFAAITVNIAINTYPLSIYFNLR